MKPEPPTGYVLIEVIDEFVQEKPSYFWAVPDDPHDALHNLSLNSLFWVAERDKWQNYAYGEGVPHPGVHQLAVALGYLPPEKWKPLVEEAVSISHKQEDDSGRTLVGRAMVLADKIAALLNEEDE